jgi:hypothetical protein
VGNTYAGADVQANIHITHAACMLRTAKHIHHPCQSFVSSQLAGQSTTWSTAAHNDVVQHCGGADAHQLATLMRCHLLSATAANLLLPPKHACSKQ